MPLLLSWSDIYRELSEYFWYIIPKWKFKYSWNSLAFQVIWRIHLNSWHSLRTLYVCLLPASPDCFNSIALIPTMLEDLISHWHPCLFLHLSFLSCQKILHLENSYSSRICSHTVFTVMTNCTMKSWPGWHMFLDSAPCRTLHWLLKRGKKDRDYIALIKIEKL